MKEQNLLLQTLQDPLAPVLAGPIVQVNDSFAGVFDGLPKTFFVAAALGIVAFVGMQTPELSFVPTLTTDIVIHGARTRTAKETLEALGYRGLFDDDPYMSLPQVHPEQQISKDGGNTAPLVEYSVVEPVMKDKEALIAMTPKWAQAKLTERRLAVYAVAIAIGAFLAFIGHDPVIGIIGFVISSVILVSRRVLPRRASNKHEAAMHGNVAPPAVR